MSEERLTKDEERIQLETYPVPVPVDGSPKMPEMLWRMKRVLEQLKKFDADEMERNLRRLLESAPSRFMDTLTKMQTDYNEDVREWKKGQLKETLADKPLVHDAGTKRCLDLLEQFLRERSWEG